MITLQNEDVVLAPKDEKQLVMINASALSKSSCRLRLFNIVVEGLTTKLNGNDIEWGTAFHIFRQVFREQGYDNAYKHGLKLAQAYYANTPMRVKSKKEYLTEQYLLSACISYAEQYKKDSFETINIGDTVGLIEQKFAIPYYVDDTMEVVLCGTVDEIGKFRNGIYSICDLKTSAAWNHTEYFESYWLSPQMMFYRWQLGLYAAAYPDSIYAKIHAEDCGVFIDGVFHNGARQVEFKRSSVMLFKEAQLEKFGRLVDIKVKQLIEDIKHWRYTGQLPLEEGILNGACQEKFGLCAFANICKAPDDEVKQHIKDHNFIKQPYNPLTIHD